MRRNFFFPIADPGYTVTGFNTGNSLPKGLLQKGTTHYHLYIKDKPQALCRR